MSAVQSPENGTVVLRVPSIGLEINTFVEYEYNSDYLTPTDGWHFVIGDDVLQDSIIKTLLPGTRVQMSINGHIQGDGLIDGVRVASSRSGGTEITIHGRDRLAQVVDSCMNPRLQLLPSMTALDAAKSVLSSFGFDNYIIDNETNVNLMTGARRGTPTSKKGKPLKNFELHQLKPYPGEGCFAFLGRILQRLGLWFWLSADGNSVIVATPDFDQGSIYSLKHKRGPTDIYNNVITSTSDVDYSSQPSCIIATGFGTGGENACGVFSLGVVNPAIDTDNSGTINAYPNTRFISWPDSPWIAPPVAMPFARPLFLHDEESKTPLELEYFLRREIALRARKTLTYRCEVEGHGVSPTTGDVGEASTIIWAVDTIVDVDDDISNIHEPLWILSRTFKKSRAGGTTTSLEAIRPHTLEF